MMEILTDALADSIKMLPFLFAAYWLIEFVERRHRRSGTWRYAFTKLPPGQRAV